MSLVYSSNSHYWNEDLECGILAEKSLNEFQPASDGVGGIGG